MPVVAKIIRKTYNGMLKKKMFRNSAKIHEIPYVSVIALDILKSTIPPYPDISRLVTTAVLINY